MFTSLEPISVFGDVGYVLSSSSYVMFSLGLYGSSIVLSFSSSNSIILASAHAMESFSTN
jgi:hypothetical protein